MSKIAMQRGVDTKYVNDTNEPVLKELLAAGWARREDYVPPEPDVADVPVDLEALADEVAAEKELTDNADDGTERDPVLDEGTEPVMGEPPSEGEPDFKPDPELAESED